MAEYPLLGVSRLRMEVDGEGVTTLVAGAGCPLSCRWCINKTVLQRTPEWVGAATLYERVKRDDLYFRATGGGVTFGGGESLLHVDFVREFRALCGGWKLYAETSLHVPAASVEAAAAIFDGFIVDIKTDDPEIYRAYTGGDAALALENLRRLLQLAGPARVAVRVPLIPEFNTHAQQQKTVETVRALGATRIEAFSYVKRQP